MRLIPRLWTSSPAISLGSEQRSLYQAANSWLSSAARRYAGCFRTASGSSHPAVGSSRSVQIQCAKVSRRSARYSSTVGTMPSVRLRNSRSYASITAWKCRANRAFQSAAGTSTAAARCPRTRRPAGPRGAGGPGGVEGRVQPAPEPPPGGRPAVHDVPVVAVVPDEEPRAVVRYRLEDLVGGADVVPRHEVGVAKSVGIFLHLVRRHEPLFEQPGPGLLLEPGPIRMQLPGKRSPRSPGERAMVEPRSPSVSMWCCVGKQARTNPSQPPVGAHAPPAVPGVRRCVSPHFPFSTTTDRSGNGFAPFTTPQCRDPPLL